MLGKRIRRLRQIKGYTQERLAEESGLSVAFIGLAERGKECPSIKTASRIAEVLGVSLSELFDFPERSLHDDRTIEESLEMLSRRLKTIRKDNARFVLDMMERLIERLERG